MGRTHQTLSFGTTRCIGIVRTMAILAHLTCLRIWCDEMLRYCGDNTYIIVIMIYRSYIWLWIICVYRLLKPLYLHCGLAILQWSKDYSDTTVFGWPTLWMSNRTFCSTLRFEAVRCYLYVENWFEDGTLCSDDVLYSEEHCTEDCEWITSFLNSNAVRLALVSVRLALSSWLFTFGWEPVCFENFWECFDVFATRWICRFVAAGIVSTNLFLEELEVC